MRLVPLLFALSALGGNALGARALFAQAAPQQTPRWEAGLAMLVGIDPLVGGTLAFRALASTRMQVAVELGVYGPLFPQREWGCFNAGGGCENGGPIAQARSLGSLGLRASVPLMGRWYAVAEGAMVQGRWRYPVSGSALRAASGLGIGRNSRRATRSLELRWQRIGTTGATASAWRLGWSQRW